MKPKELNYIQLLRRKKELGVKVATSKGIEYKESLIELFEVKEEIERRKHANKS